MIKEVVFIIFFVFLSNIMFGQTIVFLGQERASILEEIYYVFTITSDTSVIVETYKESKGQISYFDLFDVGEKSDSKLLEFKAEKVDCKNGNYFFIGKNYVIQSEIKGSVFVMGDKRVKLQSIDEGSGELLNLRNSSLLTYAFYFPNKLLGIKREFTYDEQVIVKKVLRDDMVAEAFQSMSFDDFKTYLLKRLETQIFK
jgi:hypothetical protein